MPIATPESLESSVSTSQSWATRCIHVPTEATSAPAFPYRTARMYRRWVADALVAAVGTWMQRVAQDWLVLHPRADRGDERAGDPPPEIAVLEGREGLTHQLSAIRVSRALAL